MKHHQLEVGSQQTGNVEMISITKVGRGVLLALLLLGQLACWRSDHDKAQAKVDEAWSRLQELEAKAVDDEAAADLATKVERRLRDARDRMTEADYLQAIAILDDLLFQLDNYLRYGPELETGPRAIEFEGTTSYLASDGSWHRITGDESLEDISGISAAFRGQVTLNLKNGSVLELRSESQALLSNYNPVSGSLDVTLDKGTLALHKKGPEDVMNLAASTYHAKLMGEVSLELAHKELTKGGYLAVYQGSASWTAPGKSGTLSSNEALSWYESGQEVVLIPVAPRIEFPPPHETVHTGDSEEAEVTFRWYTQLYNASFQLQVSENNLFVSRVFDQSSITDSQEKVKLAPGEYSWRVRGFALDKRQNKIPGPYTKTLTLYVSDSGIAANSKGDGSSSGNHEEDLGPKPEVHDLDFQSIGGSIIVTGRTQEGIRVKVNGVSAIFSEGGKFRAIIETHPGKQTIRVVATNPDTGARSIVEQVLKI